LSERGRSSEKTPFPNRDSAVDVRQRPGVARQKIFTRDFPHRLEHSWIGDALRPQLALDHRFTGSGEIGDWALNRHSCYMPIIHLEFKLALIDSRRARQPPFIERLHRGRGVDRKRTLAPKRLLLPGPMAEWLRRGLQILARRFDSGSGLHPHSE